MTLFFLIVFGVYSMVILLLMVGWKKEASPNVEVAHSRITIVIPFRNEENIMEELIDNLRTIAYPSEKIEIILIDDHSEDRSSEIAARKISGSPHFKLLSLPEGKFGKKQAITYAVEKATGEIIATTDADCNVQPKWLDYINDCFADDTLKLVMGGVRIGESRDLFSQLQALEFSSLVGVCGATSGLGIPTTCNGANLAFRKSAFQEVKGYDGNLSIASGDDEFLMRKIKDRFPKSIYFLAAPDSVVTTRGQKTMRDFVQQRLRWAGKWKHNSSRISQILAVFVLVFHASFVWLLILTLSDNVNLKLAGSLFGIKLLLEYFFLHPVTTFLRMKFRVSHFLLLQFIYPFYVIFVGLGSLFLKPTWKGRMV